MVTEPSGYYAIIICPIAVGTDYEITLCHTVFLSACTLAAAILIRF